MALSLVTIRDFHGPFLKLPTYRCTPTYMRVQPELARPRPRAVVGVHATKCERNTTIHAVDAVVSNLELTCRLLLSFFPVHPKNMKVLSPVEELQRAYLNPRSVRKMERGKLSRTASVR